MLRFDVPQVWSNLIRREAFVNHVVCWIALAGYPWVLLLPRRRAFCVASSAIIAIR
jgi:hypothetical protein